MEIYMENRITIREAITENDVASFWKQLCAYYRGDIFPDTGDGDRDYFLRCPSGAYTKNP